jgi:hypothetical protein
MKLNVKRIMITLAGVICLAVAAHGQDPQYTGPRDLVQRVQEDIRRSADFARQSPAIKRDRKQIERWDNAQHSLSNFDRNLSKGYLFTA